MEKKPELKKDTDIGVWPPVWKPGYLAYTERIRQYRERLAKYYER